MKTAIATIFSFLFITAGARGAVVPDEVSFADAKADTTLISQLLTEAAASLPHSTPNERILFFGRQLLGTPYAPSTLESTGGTETLRVDMHRMDCTTFVETVMALAYTAGEGRTSWRDFIYNLERIRYRGGSLSGYASRLHYPSDWIIDNAHRGNLKEITSGVKDSWPMVKTIDFMTRNRDKYPSLADDDTFRALQDVERGFRSHRYYVVKPSKIPSKGEMPFPVKEGDILLLATKTQGLDVQHMGILVMENGSPHLMHESSAAKAAVIDKLSLSDYLKRNPSVNGVRIVRLTD